MHDPRLSTSPTQRSYSDPVEPTPCLAPPNSRPPIGETTMSSIEQLGKDRWRARWRDPGGRQKARTFTQKDFADNYPRNIDAAIQTRTYVDPSLGYVKVKDFAAKWMGCGSAAVTSCCPG